MATRHPQPTGQGSSYTDVRKLEDALINTNLGLGNLKISSSMPLRPAFGTTLKDKTVELQANYVEIVPGNEKLLLHRYDIRVKVPKGQPDVTGKKLAQVVRLLLETPGMVQAQNTIVTDFASTVLSTQRLNTTGDDVEIKITYRSENEEEPRENATIHTVRVRNTGVLSVRSLLGYLRSSNVSDSYDGKQEMIQAFNIMLNHYAKSNPDSKTIGSARVFPMPSKEHREKDQDLGGGLIAIRGFFASVRGATGRILVNVNVSNAAFYQAVPLVTLMRAFSITVNYNLPKLASFLKRVRVQITHLPDKKNKAGRVLDRVKTIFGLATPDDGNKLVHPPHVPSYGASSGQVEFWWDKENCYVSVFEFFRIKYPEIQLNEKIPVVNVGTKDQPTYLPPEVCKVPAGQAARRKLDPKQTQAMINFAVRGPAPNRQSIERYGLDIVGLKNTNPHLAKFGVSVVPRLVTVEGRMLSAPKVLYGNQDADIKDAKWNMKYRRFSKTKRPTAWTYFTVSLRGWKDHYEARDEEKLQRDVKNFSDALKRAGIDLPDVSPPSKTNWRQELTNVDDDTLDETMKKIVNHQAGFKIVLVIIPDNIPQLYNRIKLYGDVKHGLHTICVVAQKFAAGKPSYHGNVSLKFNLKTGGTNQLLRKDGYDIIGEGKTMIVGVDVTHPSPGSASNAPSIAAMVASVDKDLGQWPAELGLQEEARQEMVSNLKEMLKSRLSLWAKHNNRRLPENILVYRDGVSEGQYQLVLDNEVPLLRKACQEVYPAVDQKNGLPRLTVIVVGKRHHTRFYVIQTADGDGKGNTKPGTVVDRGITEARNWDFFLQSHAAIQGTARPAHYFVVLDEIFRNHYTAKKNRMPEGCRNVADVVEQLTLSLCYTYGRATAAVSVCTPAYYADIACERARRYLGSVFDNSVAGSVTSQNVAFNPEDIKIHNNLKDSMFYI